MGDRDNCREVEGKREYLGGKRERRGGRKGEKTEKQASLGFIVQR